MEHQRDNDRSKGRPGSGLRRVVPVLMAVLTIAAVAKELKQPSGNRRWHGRIAAFVPYDFRPPTLSRLKTRMWNPNAPLVSPQVFGVGWTVNIGAAFSLLRDAFRGRR